MNTPKHSPITIQAHKRRQQNINRFKHKMWLGAISIQILILILFLHIH